MRNTQLDQSVPRPARGQEVLPPGQDRVPIRYLPPLLATLGAAVFLVALFALLAYLAGSIAEDNLFNPGGSGLTFSSATCALVTLLLAAATLYFANASRLAVRDVAAKPLTRDGVIMQRYSGIGRSSQVEPGLGSGGLPVTARWGRRRSGGNSFWIVLGQGDPATGPAAQVNLTPNMPAPATDSGPARPRGFVQGSGDLAAQLQQTTSTPAPAAEEPLVLPLPPARRLLRADEVNLRVDKHIYQALAVGDRVQVVYSPYLQHVYYVRRQTAAGETVILRNLALI
ncbi:MAG: hypothetical protein M3Z04_21400 [Chloroflexota bacterium]|nr:hypothetical protein [Chloroflexota bacterium]